MTKKSLFILMLLFTGLLCSAQQTPVTTANYELAARFSPKRVNKLVFSTAVNPNWFKNSDKFWYIYQTPEGTFYYIVDPATGAKKPIFDNAKLAAQLTEIVKDPFDAQNIPIQAFKLVDDRKFTFEIKSTVDIEVKDEKTGKPKKEKKVHGFEIDIATGNLTEIKDYKSPKPYPRWGSVSPDKKYVVFSRDFNLYYMDMENFEKARKNEEDSTIIEHQLTTEGTEEFGFGSGDNDFYVTEKDKKKRTGAFIVWSPDSKRFAMVRSNTSKVKDLWVIDVLAEPRPKLERYKYHMPGESEAPSRHLYVYDMESKTAKEIGMAAFKDQEIRVSTTPQLKKDMFDEIRHNVWLGDNENFYVSRVSRDLKKVDFCLANVNVDTVKTLVEERLNTYVETRSVRTVNNGKEFIWWSERTGWAHLYLYDGDGKLKNAITSGEYHVEDVVAVDPVQRVIYFTANAKESGENPYYTHQYRVNFDGSNLRLLNPGDFNHEANVSDNGKYFVNNYSRVDTAPKSSLYDNNGKKLADLEQTDLTQLFATGYKFPERFTVKAGDGKTDLYGVMYKPFDFDSTKLYPIIEYVYPGPQTEAVNASWTKGMDRVDRLAQFGFIVITVGNRGGHPARSKWYHNYGYGNLRDYGLEDKKVVAEKLAAKHKFIDINKVGIHGHSGGGFMSTAAMLVYPDFFKVAVSSAGNHENNIYNRWWSEQHHGVLEQITEKGDTTFKYSIDRNSQIAKNLKGHLMLVHGDIDNNVHPANTMRMVNALIKANKRFDMLMLPGQRHGFGDMTEYFFWRMGDYFSKHLIGDSREEREIPQMNNN
ncbi:MAG: DPP IV N-terminal domain-containing protein [Bacteroidales bacterium]|nr:DPP IV N-terminal domain-containing protein [Bacteroidales bacterium]